MVRRYNRSVPDGDIKPITVADLELADEATLAFVRAMTPGERLRATLDLHETARQLARAGVRLRHPEYSEQQVYAEAARIMLHDAG